MSEHIITIAELEAITTAPGSSFIAVDNGTTTNKITVDNFVASSNTTAAAYATEAESYAKGGTSSRTGENTDNAKYYKEQAASIASTVSDNIATAEEQVTSAIAAKNSAESYAGAAESSATQASQSASAAAGSATTASGYATSASNDATSANTSAQSALASASDALGYKDAALISANDAYGYASDAQRSASAASASADAAAAIAVRTPYIGANGNWFVWDAEENDFVDSGEKAQGDKGDTGNTGATPTISMTATTDAIASPNPSVTVTKSGTDAAPSFAMAFTGLKGPKGDTGSTGPDGVSPAVTIASITGGHSITITDKDHPGGQTFNVMDGTGAGDMLSTTYDSDSSVANAGGIADFVDTTVESYVESTLEKLDIVEDLSAYQNAVNVKDKGAVGDGTTDDSAAFAAAVAYAVNNSLDTIIIPEGSYNLNGTVDNVLSLGAALTFVGESAKTTEIKKANITAPFGIICKNITFNGGTSRKYTNNFDYYYPSYMKSKKVAILVTPTQDNASVVYDKCVFKNMDIASEAYWSTSESRKPLVNTIVTDCIFEDIGSCGIWHAVDIDNAEFVGNVFRRIGNSETITEDKFLGIGLGDISNQTPRQAINVIIRDNVFDTIYTGIDTTETPNYDPNLNANFIAVSSDQALICNNIFKDLTGYGPDRESIYTKSNVVEVCDNFILDGGAGEGYICAKASEHNTQPYRAINIHNNMLIGEIGRGIRCYGTAHIYDNSICLKIASMAIRGESKNGLDGSTGSFHVENNHIHVGIAEVPYGTPRVTGYQPDSSSVISCANKYLNGVRINGNSITVVKEDDSYNHKFNALIKVENVASNTEVKGNISSVSVSDAAIKINDTNASTQTVKTFIIDVEDNVFGEQVTTGFYFDVNHNAYYTKKFIIKNNIVKKRAASDYPGITVNSVSSANNDEVVYESTQAVDAFYSTNDNDNSNNKHLRITNAKALYTSLSSDYYYFGSGAQTVVYSTNFADYALASSVPTALSALSDDSTHRLVTDTEKSTWSGKSTVTTDHDGTASSSGVRKQRISIDGTYYDIDGSVYMEQTITLSTSASVTATFTNAAILSTSVIAVYAGRSGGDVSGSKNAFPFESIYTTAGSCAVTFPKEDSAISLKVRIYIK